MKTTTTSDNLNILELIRPLLKWWWLLVISALLAGVSSAFYTLQQPQVYSSTTTIMVGTALSDPNPNSGALSMASQLAAAYADIAGRSTLQEATKAVLGLTWLPEYTVRHVPNTQLIEISVVDTIPERAQAVSQALADQLILQTPGGQSEQGRQQFIENQLSQLEGAIADTDDEIDRLELEMAKMFSARQIADTKAQLAALESKKATLQNNYATMFSNSNRSATNTIVVVEAAHLPTLPLNSDLIRNVLLAVILGGAIAGAGAYVLEYSNNTLKTEQEIQSALDVLSLGILPQIDSDTKHPTGLLSTPAYRSELSDAYAALRLNVQTVLRRLKIQTFAVTCPTIDERRPSIAANLCVELARAGSRVILIDADLHRPSQQRLFGLSNHFGLASLLSDDTLQPEQLLQGTHTHGLFVLTSGPLPANPAALLGQKRMRAILNQLSLQADYIVVDVPPVNAVVDASLVANEVDGVIITVVAEQTRKQDVEQAIQTFKRLDVEIIGTILCNASMQGASQQYGYQAPPKSQDTPQPSNEIIVYKGGNTGNHTLVNGKPSSTALVPTVQPQGVKPTSTASGPKGPATATPKTTDDPVVNSSLNPGGNNGVKNGANPGAIRQPTRRNPFARN